MTQRQVALTIDSRLVNLATLGAAIGGLTSMLEFDELDAYNIHLCLVEAVSNSIVHSYSSEPGHDVVVVATIEPDQLRLEVVDQGAPVPEDKQHPSCVEHNADDIDSLSEGGRGIYLIQAMMDEVEFRRQGGENTLVMIKRYARPA